MVGSGSLIIICTLVRCTQSGDGNLGVFMVTDRIKTQKINTFLFFNSVSCGGAAGVPHPYENTQEGGDLTSRIHRSCTVRVQDIPIQKSLFLFFPIVSDSLFSSFFFNMRNFACFGFLSAPRPPFSFPIEMSRSEHLGLGTQPKLDLWI